MTSKQIMRIHTTAGVEELNAAGGSAAVTIEYASRYTGV